MQKTNYIVIVLVLIVGVLIGCMIGQSRGRDMNDMHKMNDGKMMMNHSMSGMMEDMNASLRGKTGAEFDNAFVDEMIVHHEGAVDMAKLVLISTTRPELLKMAQEIIDVQTKEINQMKAWKVEWSK